MHEPKNFQKMIVAIKPFHMTHSAFKNVWAGVESECSADHGIVESQNSLSWKGPLKVILSNPLQ